MIDDCWGLGVAGLLVAQVGGAQFVRLQAARLTKSWLPRGSSKAAWPCQQPPQRLLASCARVHVLWLLLFAYPALSIVRTSHAYLQSFSCDLWGFPSSPFFIIHDRWSSYMCHHRLSSLFVIIRHRLSSFVIMPSIISCQIAIDIGQYYTFSFWSLWNQQVSPRK